MVASRRGMAAMLLAMGILHALAPVATAQIGGNRIRRPLDKPTISPYLNLTRGGNNSSSIVSYYGVVRPQQQAHQQYRDVQRNLRHLSSRPEEQQSQRRRYGMANQMSGVTGHVTFFGTIGGARSLNGGGNGEQDNGQGNPGQFGNSGHPVNFGGGNRAGGGQGIGSSGGSFQGGY